MDRPVPARSDAEIEALVERHYRWNFRVNLVQGILWWLGVSFLSSSTIIPLFISKLTDSTWPLGLAAMLAQGGWYLPQLFAANWTERLPRRKPAAISLGFLLELVPTWLLVIPAVLAGRWAILALALFLVFYALRYLGGGAAGPAWQDLIARVIPVERRGGFWGLTSSLGTISGVAASALSAWLLMTYPFPTSFVLILALAAAVSTVSWFFLFPVRELARPVPEPRRSQRQFFAGLPRLLRQDEPFRRFLLARGLLALAGMGLGFVTVAAVRRWGVADGTVGIYTAVLMAGQGVGSLAFGLLADRRGHKLSLEWAAGLYAVAFALVWLAADARWYYLVFALLGAGQGAQLVSGILVVMEYGEPQRRPTYIGIASTTIGLVNMVGPLLGAWLAGIDYGLLFALNTAISLAALVTMRWWVQEPRWAVKTG